MIKLFTSKRLFTIFCAFSILLSSCGRQDAAESETRLTATVTRGPLEITVRGAGEIRSKNSNKIIPKIRSSSVISYLVPDGSSVEKGDVVARFNTDDIERRINDIEARIEENLSKLNSAKTDLEIQIMDNTTNLKKANLDLTQAEMELKKFISGDKPLELRNAELKIRTAESELSRKKTRLDDLRSLLKEGFVTQDEVDEQSMAVDTAEISLETARIEKELLETYTLKLREQTYNAAVESAKTELEKTIKQNTARLDNRKQTVSAAQQTLERSRADLQTAQEELAACEVKAPVSGIVMHGDPNQRRWRSDIAVGATVHRGQVIMGIPDMSDLEVAINVHEADIHRIQPGQKARITVDAIDQRIFEGEVTYVAQVANSDGWLPSDVKEFEVKLSISGHANLKPGFSCEAEIITEQIPSTLYLPVAAVFREEDEYFVYTESRRGGQRRKVTTGSSSVQFVEITEGLEEGEKALLVQESGDK